MTKDEAKKLVKRTAIVILRAEIDNGSDWIIEDDAGKDRSAADVERIHTAIRALADRLESEGKL